MTLEITLPDLQKQVNNLQGLNPSYLDVVQPGGGDAQKKLDRCKKMGLEYTAIVFAYSSIFGDLEDKIIENDYDNYVKAINNSNAVKKEKYMQYGLDLTKIKEVIPRTKFGMQRKRKIKSKKRKSRLK
jgi:hypothetical protein